MTRNPYEGLPAEAFWRSAVVDREPAAINGVWRPKFDISKKDRIVTAGSCFAQNISHHLREAGYSWFDAEPAPPGLSSELRRQHGYGIFSFRTGNIYTSALLRQWVSWANRTAAPPDEIWELDGRFYDPFRPVMEPGGFASLEDLLASRAATLSSIRRAMREADIWLFTFGLTEAWTDADTGALYPMCPGTAAGEFDAEKHLFVNFDYAKVREDLEAAFDMIKTENPAVRFLVTVSPVPLTATASGEHALTANTYSKSLLRAVAGDVVRSRPDTDYFPGYELVTGSPFRSMFYQDNLRNVTPGGVAFVMRTFFDALSDHRARHGEGDLDEDEVDPACEDELLDAFGG
ncbi:MAG: GSCFA domain-containing protein [Caulobacteraceae bacterium]|nr:GSCFA domain-containing protein [Caulobacteraceae bacterium]